MSDLSPRTGPDTPAAHRRKRPWLPLAVLGIVLVAGGVIVTQFLRSAVDYYCNVDEIDVRSGCDGDRRLRLQGVVERGTIVEQGGDTDFLIAFNGATVPVHYDGEPGGIFKECIAVVVHGRFDDAAAGAGGADGAVFMGDRVEVKHSDEYVAVNDERLDESDAQSDACESGTGA